MPIWEQSKYMIKTTVTYFRQRMNPILWIGVSGYLCLLVIPFFQWRELVSTIIWVFLWLILLRWWDDLWHYRKDKNKPNRVYTEDGKQIVLWSSWSLFFILLMAVHFYSDISFAWLLLVMMALQLVQYAFAFLRRVNSDFLPLIKYSFIYLTLFWKQWSDWFPMNFWVLALSFSITLLAKWVEWRVDHPRRNSKAMIAAVLFVFLMIHQFYYFYVSTSSTN